MSVTALSLALGEVLGSPPAKLVLVVMAASAGGDDSTFVWTGRQSELANRCDMTVDQLYTWLDYLYCARLIGFAGSADGVETWTLRFGEHHDEECGRDLDVRGARTPVRRYPAARIAPSKRRYVYDRDSYMCKRCGTLDDLSIDHIVPRSKGGGNEVENLQTLCRSCNSSKGAKCHGPE